MGVFANIKVRLPRMLDKFARNDATGGVIMLFCTILALVLQNGSYSTSYRHWLEMQAGIIFGDFELIKPLLLWINDGLITIFFFSIGLELKIEFIKGHLSTLRSIILPSLGAIAGIVVPSLFFIAFNYDNEYAMRGWAIPTSTDTAFAVAIILLLGSRVPASLRVFLLSMAIFDDIGAILVIALFYTSELSAPALVSASFAILCLLTLNYFGVARKLFYLIFGVLLWFSIFKSGMHATLAGIITAFCIPMKSAKGDLMVENIYDNLKMWVSLLVLPVFTLANAGVDLSMMDINAFLQPVSLGIFTGLFLGKQIGIFAIIWLCVKLRIVQMPSDANYKQIYGVCILTGIGFSMSMFIDSLAYQGSSVFNYADSLAILVASFCSGVLGYCFLRFYACRTAVIEYRPWLPAPGGYKGTASTANLYIPTEGPSSVAPTAVAVAEANARAAAAAAAAAAAEEAAAAAATAAEAAKKVVENEEVDDVSVAQVQLAAAQAAQAAATAAASSTKLDDTEDEEIAEVVATAAEAAEAAADIAAETADEVAAAVEEAEAAEEAEATEEDDEDSNDDSDKSDGDGKGGDTSSDDADKNVSDSEDKDATAEDEAEKEPEKTFIVSTSGEVTVEEKVVEEEPQAEPQEPAAGASESTAEEAAAAEAGATATTASETKTAPQVIDEDLALHADAVEASLKKAEDAVVTVSGFATSANTDEAETQSAANEVKGEAAAAEIGAIPATAETEKPANGEKPAKAEKAEKTEKSNKAEKSEKTEKADKAEKKAKKSAETEKSAKAEKKAEKKAKKAEKVLTPEEERAERKRIAREEAEAEYYKNVVQLAKAAVLKADHKKAEGDESAAKVAEQVAAATAATAATASEQQPQASEATDQAQAKAQTVVDPLSAEDGNATASAAAQHAASEAHRQAYTASEIEPLRAPCDEEGSLVGAQTQGAIDREGAAEANEQGSTTSMELSAEAAQAISNEVVNELAARGESIEYDMVTSPLTNRELEQSGLKVDLEPLTVEQVTTNYTISQAETMEEIEAKAKSEAATETPYEAQKPESTDACVVAQATNAAIDEDLALHADSVEAAIKAETPEKVLEPVAPVTTAPAAPVSEVVLDDGLALHADSVEAELKAEAATEAAAETPAQAQATEPLAEAGTEAQEQAEAEAPAKPQVVVDEDLALHADSVEAAIKGEAVPAPAAPAETAVQPEAEAPAQAQAQGQAQAPEASSAAAAEAEAESSEASSADSKEQEESGGALSKITKLFKKH